MPTLPHTLQWTADASRPAPFRAQVYRGESVRLSAALCQYASPVGLDGAVAAFYWQPADPADPAAWWTAPAEISGNTVSAVFDAATMDDGSDSYRFFFRVSAGGATYRANGILRMLPSPGAVPNEIPFPPRILDFATVEVLNAPYWTKEEADGRYASVADATLNGRESWAFSGDTEEGVVYEVRYDFEYEGEILWALYADGGLLSTGDANESATEEEFPYDEDKVITATRTALPGYVLGSQTDKPIPKLSDIPAVVAPSTAADAAGKAADAKATGDALAWKVSKSGDTMTGALMFDRQGAATAEFSTYDEDTGERPTLTLAFDCDPLSEESGAVTASGEFAMYGYMAEQVVWRRFRLDNARYYADGTGHGNVVADIVDADTGDVVSEGSYISASFYEYDGYVEVSLYFAFGVGDIYFDNGLYGDLTSRSPTLSGRAATTPELEAVKSTANSAYSAANSKATMTQVNSAITTHNNSASAHSAAITTQVNSAITAHNNSAVAHAFSVNGVYKPQADTSIATDLRGAYLFTDGTGRALGDIRTAVDLCIVETTDSAAWQEHQGNFVVAVPDVFLGSTSEDTTRRTVRLTIMIRDRNNTAASVEYPQPIKTVKVITNRKRTNSSDIFTVFDRGSISSPIAMLSMDLVLNPFTDILTNNNELNVKASSIRLWSAKHGPVVKNHSLIAVAPTLADTSFFLSSDTGDEADHDEFRVTTDGCFEAGFMGRNCSFSVSVGVSATIGFYTRNNAEAFVVSVGTKVSYSIPAKSGVTRYMLRIIRPNGRGTNYLPQVELLSAKATVHLHPEAYEPVVGRLQREAVEDHYGSAAAAQAAFDAAAAGTASLADLNSMMAAMYKTIGFAPTATT